MFKILIPMIIYIIYTIEFGRLASYLMLLLQIT